MFVPLQHFPRYVQTQHFAIIAAIVVDLAAVDLYFVVLQRQFVTVVVDAADDVAVAEFDEVMEGAVVFAAAAVATSFVASYLLLTLNYPELKHFRKMVKLQLMWAKFPVW